MWLHIFTRSEREAKIAIVLLNEPYRYTPAGLFTFGDAGHSLAKMYMQGPKLPCSCWLHTLPRLRASQGSNLCEANSRRYRWKPIKHLGMPVLKDEPRVSPCACASVL